VRFEIVKRMQTRRTSYTMRALQRALTDLGLAYTNSSQALILTANFDPSRRHEIETRLRLVHRNIPYTVQQGIDP